MIDAILLAAMLAIIAANVAFGPRGYRLLAEAGLVERKAFLRRLLRGQLTQFALPPVVGLALLGRFDAVISLPRELWSASLLLRGDTPAVEADPLLTWVFFAAIVAAVPLGAFLTWRRLRKGKGVPAYLAHLSALLPRDREEVLIGAAISVAAGIGEELFFRLLLPMLLAAFVGGVPAVVLAVVLFGLGHAYQGWKGIITTTLVGAMLTALYLMSGSLAIVMLLHATIDLMALVIRPAIRGAW